MTKISDKSADNQSKARISVAYNKNCHLSLMESFVKRPPYETVQPDPPEGFCQGRVGQHTTEGRFAKLVISDK